jgi:adenylylsulfate reductase subunit A
MAGAPGNTEAGEETNRGAFPDTGPDIGPEIVPEVVEEQLDILIIGGGMAACGAAYEIVPWLDAAREQGTDLRVKLVDKAAMARSGAVAQGLASIGAYLGGEDPADYARMVSHALMGISRDDLAYDLGRHLDDSVHLFEAWGLPVGKQPDDDAKALADGARPLRAGNWDLVVHGESLKPIVAEAARRALGPERVQEHVCIVRLLADADEPGRIAGAVGFSVREHRVYVYTCRACLLATGGGGGLFRPRAVGEGAGNTWSPGWSAASTYAMAAEVGAELTMMESRTVPIRFKDGYGPVRAWLQRFEAKILNGDGAAFLEANKALLEAYAPYGQSKVPPPCLRNHLLLHELREGRGPIYMDTVGALGKLAERMAPKEIKRLEAEVWRELLDSCAAQAGVWAGGNIEPEKRQAELMPAEPSLLGSDTGCCGLWTSGPADLGAPTGEDHADRGKIPSHLPEGWSWGYRGMTTVRGLFTAGDGVGASGHKYAAGSHAEGRIAAKAMVAYCLDHLDLRPAPDTPAEQLAEDLYRPLRNHQAHRDQTTDSDINPETITPDMLLLRLQKIMDEYVAGVSTLYQTNGHMLAAAEQKLEILKQDARRVRAKDLHELLRCWEHQHRILTAEAHLLHVRFREESRYPGFYYRTDHNHIDEEHWKCFVNSVYDKASGTWTCFKRAHVDLVDKSKLFKEDPD